MDVIVKDSKISGKGIFAARDFKKGDLAVRWSSHRNLLRSEVEKLSEAEKNHVSFINGQFILVPSDGWVNHSCDPNVYLDKFCYFAKRDILIWEELTADYRLESEKVFTEVQLWKKELYRKHYSIDGVYGFFIAFVLSSWGINSIAYRNAVRGITALCFST